MTESLSENWEDKISKQDGKDNLPTEIWERIKKIRNSPIRLKRDIIIGDDNKPHIVLPAELRGYIIDCPEAFSLSENNQIDFESAESINRLPATINGYGKVVFLKDEDYEIIPPYFDINLASGIH